MPAYQDILPAQPEESLIPGLSGYESDEDYAPAPEEPPETAPLSAVPADPVISAEAYQAYAPVAESEPVVTPPPIEAPAPIQAPTEAPRSLSAPIYEPPPDPPSLGMRIVDVPDQPVQILSATPVLPAVSVNPSQPEEPAYTVLPPNANSSLELLTVLPTKELPPKKHFFVRPKRTELPAEARGVSAVVQGGLTATLIFTLVIVGSYLLFGQGDLHEDFHGAAPVFETFTDKVNAFISGFVNGDKYRWDVILFDGAKQTDGRARRLAPGSPFTVQFSAGATCELSPMTIMEETKDGNGVLRAQRGITCPEPWEVETTGKGTTDCTVVSNGIRYQDSDMYTVKSGTGQVVGSLIMNCQIL